MHSTPIRSFLVNRLAASPLVPGRLRRAIYNWCGMQIQTTALNHSMSFAGFRLSMAPGAFVNVGCHFDCATAPIIIAENVAIGPRVMFLTTTHEIGPNSKRAGVSASKPVQVGPGCWIGAGAIILPGVSIGAGCVIAAGAVVTKDCDPDELYAGVPARKVRALDPD